MKLRAAAVSPVSVWLTARGPTPQLDDSILFNLVIDGGQVLQLLARVARRGDAVVLLNPPVLEDDDAVGVGRDVRLVRDEDERDPALAVEALEDVHHLDRGARVERARRLVGEDELRVVDERARNRHALLLPARELVRVVLLAARESDRVQRFRRAAVALGRLDARVEHRQLDVLKRRRAREEVEALEDEAELAKPDVCAL